LAIHSATSNYITYEIHKLPVLHNLLENVIRYLVYG
jgi:hypothetical protein